MQAKPSQFIRSDPEQIVEQWPAFGASKGHCSTYGSLAMKNFIIALTLVASLALVPIALARDANRDALQRNRLECDQKKNC